MCSSPDGVFSPYRFVTTYSNISDRAKLELFTPAQRAALDDLLRVSQFVQQRVTRYANPSGTARGLFGGGLLTGMMADPISVISGAIGSRLAAQALSRPAVIRAAIKVTRAKDKGDLVATQRE